jgi:hypothetical protein
MDSDTYNDMAGSISDLTEECRDRGLEITRLRGLLGEIEKDHADFYKEHCLGDEECISVEAVSFAVACIDHLKRINEGSE